MNKSQNPNTNDLGLGNKVIADRNMNKNGTYNIVRIGDPGFRPYEIFHNLLTMSWTRFFLIVLTIYIMDNLFFASIYTLIGVENLAGVPEGLDLPHQFLEAFFFSSQTITTLGYGRVAPVGIFANTFAALESMIGLMVFALATGLLYGRFSRPDAKLLYSEHAVIAPYQDINALMFRLINKRRNQLIELEIDVTIGFFDVATQKRSFARLELERNKINLFPLSWTIVHPINEASPFWKKSPDDFAKMKLEVIVLLKGFDDTFSQTIYSRTSYTNSEIVWGKKFLPMFSSREDGRAEVDLRKINLMENAPLNT